MKKILIYFIALILLASFCYADLTDGLVSYYSFDNNANDYYGINDATVYGADKVGSCKLNGCYYYNRTDRDYLNLSNDVSLRLTTTGTFSAWVYVNSQDTDGIMFLANKDGGAGNRGYVFYTHADGDLCIGQPGVYEACSTGAAADVGNGRWVYIVGKRENGYSSVYINGTLKANASNVDWNATTFDQLVGRLAGSTNYDMDGYIDELGIWNRSLSYSEIQQLWNAGNGLNPTAENTTIIFTAIDDFNGSSITSYAVNISWPNGTVQSVGTGNGTLSVEVTENNNFNINVTYWNTSNYYNLTLLNEAINANTSNSVVGSIYQAVLCLETTAKISGNAVVMDNYVIEGVSRTECFNITAGSHNILANKTQWYNKNATHTVTALTNTTFTITDVYSSLVNISAYYTNFTKLTSFGIQLYSSSLNASWSENTTTTNGTVWYYLINGTYTAHINSSQGNETFNFTVDQYYENFTFHYFDIDNCSDYSNTILNFTMLTEEGNAFIDNTTMNIWLNITGDYLTSYRTFNFSFGTGHYYALCVPNGTLTNYVAYAQIEYSDLPTYSEKNYYLVDYLLNTTETSINLYLTNNTAQVTLQVRDYNDDAIPDAYISVLSYDLSTNSYRTTEIVKTDSSGDAYAQIVQNTNWYAFIVEYEGEILLQTLPTKITTNSLTLRVNLDTDYFASYDVTQGITYDLTFNNNTATFSFTWSDPTGGVAQGCIRLTKQSINGETVLNTSCTTSSAATLLMTIPEAVGTNTYRADAYVTISGQNFPLDTLSHSYNTTYRTFGLSGIFLSMLVILTLVMVGLWHPAAAVILMVVGVVTTNVMGIFYLNWTYIITFIILAVITIYRTGRSE